MLRKFGVSGSFDEGVLAAQRQRSRDSCPYVTGLSRQMWLEGWDSIRAGKVSARTLSQKDDKGQDA